MYADTITDSMRLAIDETERRRTLQEAYNKEHGITPKTIQKSVRELISISKEIAQEELRFEKDPEVHEQEGTGEADCGYRQEDEEGCRGAEFRAGPQSCVTR